MLKDLSAPIQLVAFIIIVFIMSGVGEIIFGLAITPFITEPVDQFDWTDPRMTLTRALFFQIFSFLISLMLYMRYVKANFNEIIDVGALRIKPFLITLGVFIAGYFLMDILQLLNEPLRNLIPEHPAILYEDEVNAMQEKLVYHSDPVQLVFTLFIMALLPAICEELVFRGFLIHNLMKSGGNVNASILISALIFTITHFQPLKFLPILFMGICLGYVYTYFKNIKYPIILHFLINASQIIIAYYSFNF